jgi:hypothetical protein
MLLSNNFFQNMVLNSTTMVKKYIDDIICLTLSPVYKTKSVEEVSSKGNLLEQQDEILKMISLNNPVCLPWKEGIMYPKISNAELNNILVNLYSTGNIYAGSAYA